MAIPLLLLTLAGCADDPTDSDPVQLTDSAGGGASADSAAGGVDFYPLADQIPGGVLLSAWTDGGEALMVGGDISGGPGVIVRYDGERVCFEEEAADAALWWIHGPRDGEWYAVGAAGRILHEVDGVRTREDVVTDHTLFGVYATDDEVIAVGGDVANSSGQVWRRRDGKWELMAELPAMVFKAWEGWLVGDSRAWRIEGDDVVEVDAGGQRLVTGRGRDADDDVWAVGGSSSAVIMRYDGQAWTEVDHKGIGQPLTGVWTAPGETVWVAGYYGTTAFLDDDGAWVMPWLPVTTQHFHAVWPFQDEVLWIGGNLFDSGNYVGTLGRYGDGEKLIEAEACP